MKPTPGVRRGTPAGSPRQPASFIGRDSELAALRFLIQAHRLVTVTGIGGAGKTRLASELVRRNAAATADGPGRVVYVALAGLSTADEAAEAVVHAMGGQWSAVTSAAQHLATLTGTDRVLLVLDNCEHLTHGGAEFTHLVDQVLDACPGLRVLATSRLPLHAADETVWQLPPLQPQAAVRLFTDRARNVAPGWEPAARDLAAVGRVCDALAGVPLAIELAAAHAHVVTVTQMADSLAGRLLDLRNSRHDASPRQRSMRASLEWSHELLPGDQQLLLRRLAVFAGGWRLEDAEAVAADDELPQRHILPALAGLVDAALVSVSAIGDGAARYVLPELVRQYAAERLDAAGEAMDLRGRHLTHFLTLAQALGPGCRLDAERAARLREQSPNLRGAIEHALATRPQLSLRLVAALSEFWTAAGATAEPERLFGLVLAAAPAGDPLCGRVLAARSLIAFFRQDIPVAMASGEAAVRIGESTGDRVAQARGLTVLALMAGMVQTRVGLGLLDQAEGLLDEHEGSPEIALDIGFVRMALTGIEEHPEQMRRAAAEQEARLSGYRDTLWHTWFFYHRSWIWFLTGDEEAYAADIRAALAAYDAVPAVGVDAFALGDQAVNLVRTGRTREAEEHIARARSAAAASASTLALARLNAAVATFELFAGRPAQARAAIRQSLPPDPQTGLAPAFAAVLSLGGVAALAAGDVATARAEAELLLPVAGERLGGSPRFGACAQILLGRCALADGDAESAVYHLRRGLATATAGELAPQAEEALDWLGVAAVRLGHPERGLRLIAASAAARRRSGRVRFPADAELIDAAADAAQGALDAAAADAAIAQGSASALADVAEYALRGTGTRGRPATGWASLTPSEQRVAHLTADGLTNTQIAARLFVSAHTVKVHLAHAYAKLGVSGRAQLAALAAGRAAASKE
jgi:predicted ATPase/DNA-binding CsgD family transcriptional regulator